MGGIFGSSASSFLIRVLNLYEYNSPRRSINVTLNFTPKLIMVNLLLKRYLIIFLIKIVFRLIIVKRLRLHGTMQNSSKTTFVFNQSTKKERQQKLNFNNEIERYCPQAGVARLWIKKVVETYGIIYHLTLFV